jgi:hypothetical protein
MHPRPIVRDLEYFRITDIPFPTADHLNRRAKEKAPAGETGASGGRRGIGGVGGTPSDRVHVDGGFAVGASSFNRQGSPRCLSCATA